MQFFAEFQSMMYHQPTPSNQYLISRAILLMESNAEYKMRRMQLVDGKHLSGDHSFKVAKCVIAGGSKAFTAMYIIMNEFGQVVAWWFTTGTGMGELEKSIKQLKQRYSKLGYDETESFYTDRCCHDRAYLNRVFQFLDQQVDMDRVDDEDAVTINLVQMPYDQRPPAYSVDVALIYISAILDYLDSQPPELQVIIYDCEWTRGAAKAEVGIIDTLGEDAPYVFCFSEVCKGGIPFPRFLKDLLEDPKVKKVGNMMCDK